MLGYDVVEIDPVYWNSMFMSENVVRQNFLETKLYANANAGQQMQTDFKFANKNAIKNENFSKPFFPLSIFITLNLSY